MIVHFVCSGNTYRSRLAEAYFNSKGVPGIKAISSGVIASQNINGPICWYSARIVKNYGLVPEVSAYWTQTSEELLRKSDVVVFMQEIHLNHCVNNFGYNGSSYQVWNISDIIDQEKGTVTDSLDQDLKNIKISEETFKKIRKKIDRLSHEMKEQQIMDRLASY